MTGNEIRKWLIEEMREQGRSVKETAPKIYVYRHTLADWLHGKSNLPVDGLIRLLDLLGYELEIRRRR